MPQVKPRLAIRDGKPVVIKAVDPVERARQRFAQPFAHEPGSKWKPRSTPYLTEWMQTRGKQA